MKVKTYKQAKEYLDSFVNYEKRIDFSYQKSFKLERVYLLLNHLGIAYQDLKVIHIAGTKGKGSTAQFCAHLLATSGIKVGLYTSPHFFDFRERIKIVQNRGSKININMIGKEDVIRLVGEISRKLTNLETQENLGNFSFFEVYTVIAFKYFLEKRVDLAILETGLGGRLDATNVAKPSVSIITHIGYDHTDKLGKGLASIAAEKAGIIKPGVPVVCSGQRPAALGAIKQKAKSNKAPLFLLGADIKASNIRLKDKLTSFDFDFKDSKFKNLRIHLKGKHQIDNACLALAATLLLKEEGEVRNQLNINQGLRSCYLEGRFEFINKSPLTVVDIAHNVSSFWALMNNLKKYLPSKKIILIFSCAKDKDVKKMLRQINYSYIILTRFSSPRSYEPKDLKKICGLKEAFIAKGVKEAYQQAKRLYDKNSVVVISGSFFLVSDAKKLICTKTKV